jgi:hypothetical protein
MEVANHLVEIATKANELRVNEATDIVCRLGFNRDSAALVEKNRAAKMDRAHADSLGAPAKAFELAPRQAEIELPVAWF